MHFSPKFGEKGIGSTYYYIAKCIAVLVAGEHGRGHAVAGGGLIVGDWCAAVMMKQERIAAIVS